MKKMSSTLFALFLLLSAFESCSEETDTIPEYFTPTISSVAHRGYQIQYSTSSSFAKGNKTVTVKGASIVSKTITNLTAQKKYYVRIRTYKTVNGKKYYSAWSAKKNVTTK